MAVGFWELDHSGDRPAVVSADGARLTYAELSGLSEHFSQRAAVAGRKALGFLLCRNTPTCLAAYLGSLRGGHAVCLLDADLSSELLEALLSTYRPDWLFSPESREITGFASHEASDGYILKNLEAANEPPIAPELALLLPTSGSTGSPKLVRLSLKNLQANAESIVSYLGITRDDRAITSLPMPYSYGLSVMNSHLLAGGTLLMTANSFMQREYWDFIARERPTSLAGVPYHYEVMLRTRMLEKDLPGLRTLTQAGGRLDPERIEQMARLCAKRGWRFFVMYGQTEATARISYVPTDRLDQKIGSIGLAIPGGELRLDSETGELIYSGPNVMLGYAEGREDLSRGDDLHGQVRTGDLAKRDEDGYYYIVGRLKRFLKVYGRRFSLDEMESVITRHVGRPVACFGTDDHILVAVDGNTSDQSVTQVLKDIVKIHPNAFRIMRVEPLPRFPNGKVDYQSLKQLGSA